MKKIISVVCLLVMMVSMLVACTIHEHVFSTDAWAKDADYHWRACTVTKYCDEQYEKAEHEFEVTLNDEGEPVNVCKVCGESNDRVTTAPEHEHAYADEFSKNANFHWYACETENCYEVKDKREHAFGNPEVTYEDAKITITYICVDCGYERIEEQAVKTEVDNAVLWDAAFKNFKLNNFTMDVYQQYNGRQLNNHCIVTEKEAYYHIDGYTEFYTVPNGDGTYTTYQRYNQHVPFQKLKDTSDVYLKGAQVETVLKISFEENFEKFTYDAQTASYTCADVIEAECFNFDGTFSELIYCYDNIVKITDGNISYIEAKYYIESPEQDLMSFKYYNVGMSAVEVPQSVIDNAIDESGPATETLPE